MTNQPITLPLTVQRGATLQLIVPILLAEPFVFGALFYFLWESGIVDSLVVMTAVPTLLVGSMVAVWVLLRAAKPATITIDRSMVTVKPLPIPLLSSAAPATYPTQSFSKVSFINPTEENGGFCLLESKDGAERNVKFPPPRGASPQQTAEQLNRLLGFTS